MGSWGITMRESDYGLDLLGTIVDTRLKSIFYGKTNLTLGSLFDGIGGFLYAASFYGIRDVLHLEGE